MVKNHKLAKSISDCSWYELTRQLEYKSAWNSREYIKVDTYFASSPVIVMFVDIRIKKQRI